MFGLSLLLFSLVAARVYSQEIPPLSTIKIYIFTSKDCSHCKAVQEDALKVLEEKCRCKIETKYFDIENIANYSLLTKFEEKYGDTDNDLPVVFIGKDVLGGEKELAENFEKTIIKYRDKGGCPWPDEVSFQESVPIQAPSPPKSMKKSTLPAQQGNVSTKPEKEKPVYLAFFFEYSCKECQRIFHMLRYIEQKYPQVVVKEFNLTEKGNKEINEVVCNKFNVPETKRQLTATIFIGPEYFHGKDISLNNIESKIIQSTPTGTICPWDIKEKEMLAARGNIIKRFKSFGPQVVATAGIIDGINPCAFTTIVFFISYLALIGSRRLDMLLVGASFALGVFITYFLVGCGAFAFLRHLPVYSIFSRCLNMVIALLALVLGFLSLGDFFKARRGDFKGIALQLPSFIKTRIQRTISKEMRTHKHIAAAFSAGFIVSLLELACTGQVYLPTIILITGQEGMKRQGFSYLLLYNLMFILPLVVVFLVCYFGTTSEQLARFTRKNIAVVKLFTALLFFSLGIFLIAESL